MVGEPPTADEMTVEAAEGFIERFVDERDLETLQAFVDPDQIAQVGSGIYPLNDAVSTLGEERALEVGREAARDGPRPPAEVPKYLREGVERQDVTTLRALADWARQRADYLKAEAEREVDGPADQDVDETPDKWADREDDWKDQLETAREDADLGAGKGTLTTKTIDGRDYYYLQWRDGENIRSKYVAPVEPAGVG